MRTLTLQNAIAIVKIILDIAAVWILIYYVIKFVRNNARTIQIFKGILLILLIKGVSSFAGLTTISFLADMFITWGFLGVIIIFQPEIRGVLEKLGQSNVFTRISTLSGNELDILVNHLVEASVRMSKEQIGALITIEQAQSLSDYIKTGTRIDAAVSVELLCSIFVPLTPLHDGAVIIQGNQISCASAYFPPTSLDLPTRYGARHRAAIGISEITDSTTIVISEETGSISVAEHGKLTHMDEAGLREYLLKVICVQEVEAKQTTKQKVKRGDKSRSIKFDFLSKKEETVPVPNEERMTVAKKSKKTANLKFNFDDPVEEGDRKKKVNAKKSAAQTSVSDTSSIVVDDLTEGGMDNGKQR